MAKQKEETQLAVNAQAATGVAVYDDSYAEFAGEGFEGQDKSDVSIPFLSVLQSTSKILEQNRDLRAGMILNTVTGEYKDGDVGIIVVPVYTQHLFIEWRARSAGGGFVTTHLPSSAVVAQAQAAAKAANLKFGELHVGENELVETFYVYAIVVNDDGITSQVLISFTSTKIGKYKSWNTMAKTVQLVMSDGRRIPAPLFAHKYRMKTVAETRPKGKSFNWDIKYLNKDAASSRIPTSDPLFHEARALLDMIKTGQAQVKHEAQAGNEEVPVGTDGKPVF